MSSNIEVLVVLVEEGDDHLVEFGGILDAFDDELEKL